ncbi:MAG: EAL domain-containing protein [Acidobacteriota bacterium]
MSNDTPSGPLSESLAAEALDVSQPLGGAAMLDPEGADAVASNSIGLESSGGPGDFETLPQPAAMRPRRSSPRERWDEWMASGGAGDPTAATSARQVRNVHLVLFALIFASSLLAVGGWMLGLRVAAVGALFAAAFAILTLAALRRFRHPSLFAHSTVAILFASALALNVYGGGFSDVSSSWFVTVPLLAGLLIGLRATWLWTIVVALTSLGLWMLPSAGIELANQVPPDLLPAFAIVQRLAALAAVGLLLSLYLAGQKKVAEEIHGLAFNDPLTGLQNRKSFTDSLGEALDNAKRNEDCLALLFIDLDRFKEYNDTLGHLAGDQILRWVADVLESQIRSTDLVTGPGREAPHEDFTISRLGGDEFTVVLGNIGSKQRAAQAAQRLLDALCAPVTIGGVEIFVSASIGVAVFPEDGRDIETLLRRADAGMYSAKQRGGNSFEFFAPWMNEASLRRIFVENRLRRAIDRDEIYVVYQPVFESRSGRIVAAEVLARWESPSMGQVSPAEFIPIAEDAAPLIVSLGNWVLDAALGQLGEWHRAGLPRIRMSVNFAAAQLRQVGGYENVCKALERAGLEGRFLEIEVTERIALSGEEPAMEDLRRLRRRGIGVALDDFGTGSASLSYLRQLPLTRMKIDRSFVSSVTSDPREAHLTSAIVAMAKSLGLAVVAEGVETEPQAEYLRTIGCDELQGYLLGRPVSAEEFEELLRHDQALHGECEVSHVSAV